MAIIGITGSGYALFRPYVGLLLLGFLYFFRPDMWGLESEVRYIQWLTIAVALGWLLTARGEWLAGAWWLVVLLGWQVMATALAPFTAAEGWERLGEIAKIIVVALLIVRLCDTPRKLGGFLAAVLLGVVWLNKVVLLGWRAAGYSGDIRIDTAAGQGGGSNYLAWVLAATLPALVYKSIRSRGWLKVCAIGMSLVWIASIIATGSRGGFLCMVAGVGVLIVLMRKGKLLLLAGALAVVVAIAAPAAYWGRINTITTDKDEMDLSLLDRYYNAQAGMKIIKDYPLFGTGLLTFPKVKQAYTTNPNKSMSVAHNTYVQFATELGLPMLALFALLYLWLAARLARRLASPLSPRDDDHLEWVRVSVLGAMAATAVEMAKGDVAHMDFFWWVLGIGLACVRLRARAEDFAPRPAASADEKAAVPSAQPQGPRRLAGLRRKAAAGRGAV